MKEEFCCNCHWYDGVHGCQGCAECKIKHEIVLWSDCCDHLWLIPERLKIGLKTNADCIRAMSDEEMAKFMERTKFYVCKQVAEVCGIYDLEEHWDKDGIVKEEIEWLKKEYEDG